MKFSKPVFRKVLVKDYFILARFILQTLTFSKPKSFLHFEAAFLNILCLENYLLVFNHKVSLKNKNTTCMTLLF